MKKLSKWLALAVAGLVVLLAVGAIAIYVASTRKLGRTHAVTARPVAIPTGAEALARGRELSVSRGCSACHGADFAGAKVMDDGAMGRVFGPNITSGIGGYRNARDEDWVRVIRHGVNREGRGLFLMPSHEYAQMSDNDLGALVAFMKGVPPVNRESVSLLLGPISRMLLATGKMRLAADVIDHAHLQPSTVVPGLTVEYGKYIAVACVDCHGPNYSGGKIAIGPPDWPPARNLTPHPSGNLAKWSQADFTRALREGKRPDGSEINPIMPRGFGAMNDTEIGALWLFLKSLPPAATGAR